MYDIELIYGDRRSNRRYQVGLELRFAGSEAGVSYEGFGRTLDLSRGGIHFLTDDPPPTGAEVELRIAWPLLLQDVCPLELCVWGTIVRTEGPEAVVRMRSYEFRTCGARSFNQPGRREETCSILG